MEVLTEVKELRWSTIISYGASISACEKALEWRRALDLLHSLPEPRFIAFQLLSEPRRGF